MPFQSKQKSRNLQPSLHPSCIHPWFLYIDTKFTCFCIWKWPDPARMGWHLVRIAIETILQIPVHRLLTFHHHRSQANTQTDSAWDDDLQKAISTCCNHLGVDQYPSMSPDSMPILSHRDFLSFNHFVQLHGFSSPWAARRGSIEVLSFMDTLLCSLGNPNFHGVVREKLVRKNTWANGAQVSQPSADETLRSELFRATRNLPPYPAAPSNISVLWGSQTIRERTAPRIWHPWCNLVSVASIKILHFRRSAACRGWIAWLCIETLGVS